MTTFSTTPEVAGKSTSVSSLRIKIFYGMGSLAFGVKDNGFSVLLLLFYNQALGLDARLAGLAIMIALIVDAFVDPLIGYVSDHLNTRWGRRHPLMYAAAIPVAVSYLFLFSPPSGLDQHGLFLYLLTVSIVVRVFIALYEIPSSALVAELTQSYDERTSYLSFRFFFGWVGGLTMGTLAFAVFLRGTPAFPNGTLNPEAYRAYGYVAAAIMCVSIFVSSWGTHSSIPWLRQTPVSLKARSPLAAVQEVLTSLSSRSAVAALLANMLLSMATGLSYALGPYFYTYYWGLSGGQVSLLIFSGFGSAVTALIVTPWLSRRFEKRAITVAVTVSTIVLMPIPFVIGPSTTSPAGGSPLLLATLLVFTVLTTALSIIRGTILGSMVADVVEENEVRTGRRSEGVFFAANTFVAKCVSGLGVFVSATVLTLAAFPLRAVPGTVDHSTLIKLAGAYVAAFAGFNVAALGCILFYKITRRSHSDSLKIIASRREK